MVHYSQLHNGLVCEALDLQAVQLTDKLAWGSSWEEGKNHPFQNMQVLEELGSWLASELLMLGFYLKEAAGASEQYEQVSEALDSWLLEQ